MRAVDRRVIHVQQTRRPQLGQNARFGPVPQTSPGRHTTAVDLVSRNISPAHALAQHMNDGPQRSPVVRRQPPGIPIPPRRTSRQQRSHTFPQVTRDKISRTHQILPTQHTTAKPHNELHSETISKTDDLRSSSPLFSGHWAERPRATRPWRSEMGEPAAGTPHGDTRRAAGTAGGRERRAAQKGP